MAKPPSKKVSRVARTSGGRTARGRTPVLWYTVITMFVALGIAGVWYSRQQLVSAQATADTTSPRPASSDKPDHWHAAYGIWICDKWAPALNNDADPDGIHTHQSEGGLGDGIIHIHPFTSNAGGKNAKLSVFEEAARFKVSEDELKVPGQKTYKNGDKCGKERGEVQLIADGKPVKGDPSDFRFSKDRQWLAIAFAPKGAEIGPPPSLPGLNNLSDVPGSGAPTPSTTPTGEPQPPPSGEGTTPPAPTDTTPTSAPG